MSPEAPAFTANSGELLIGPPVPRNSRPSPATGVALQDPCMPLTSQSSFPVAASYDRTRFWPQVTISVRPSVFQTKGVLQVECSSRVLRHNSFPVFLSKATRNDSFSLSHCTNKR